jgi:acyl-CoA thioester hydrolase
MKLTLDLFKIIEKYPVHWGDMDSANHVNNLIYLRWAESARIKYFEKMEMDTSFSSGGTGPILGWQECKYIFPMTYPDTAIVGARTVEIKEDRFFIECAIFSEKHNRIAAISKQSIIPYSYGELKKVEMPDPWLEEIAKIEGS